MDVFPMPLIIRIIANTMICKASLPDFALDRQFLGTPMRESSLDELHRTLKGNLDVGRKNQVRVVRHDHEFMQKKLALCAIAKHCLPEQFRKLPAAKYGFALVANRGYEECPFVHGPDFTPALKRMASGTLNARINPCSSTLRGWSMGERKKLLPATEVQRAKMAV
jgi:hypothetical protein